MRKIQFLTALWGLFALQACVPRVEIQRLQPVGTVDSPNTFVLVKQPEDSLKQDLEPLAVISVGRPFTLGPCDERTTLSSARQTARSLGGNLIWIKSQKSSDYGCTLLQVEVYDHPDLSQEMKRVIWEEDRSLRVEDFQGVPNPTWEANALSFTGMTIELEVNPKKRQAQLIIYSYFEKLTSWILEADRGDKDLLAHEQLHFDISEYHSRLLKRRVENLNPDANDFLAKVDAEFKSQLKQLKEMQYNYDQETWHGINSGNQQVWAAKIARLLREEKP